jgi:hypothetical protein
MRSIKRMIAVTMLAMVATMGAQTAMANNGILVTDNHRDGILVTDKDGVLLSDKSITQFETSDIVTTILNSLTGILLSD